MIARLINWISKAIAPRPREAMHLKLEVKPSEVVAAAAIALGATAEDVTSGRRYKGSIRARHASALALRRLGLSYPEIAVVIHWTDHSTAMNAVRVAEAREVAEPSFRAAVAAGIAAGRDSL